MDKSKTVAFTGHRTITALTIIELSARLEQTILNLYQQGYRTFISGMAIGLDMLATEAIVKLRPSCPGMQLIAAIPYPGQPERFSPRDKQRYAALLEQADSRVLLSKYYHSGCYHRRNDYMIAKASVMVAYYDGKPSGGTYYTITEAHLRGLKVINLLQLPQ